MVDVSKNDLNLRLSIGSLTSLTRTDVDKSLERRGYWNFSGQLAYVNPTNSWATYYFGVGARAIHSDESSLGSQRQLFWLEGGARLRLPFPILDRMRLELGLGAGVGRGKLNFGGGNVPVSSFDASGAAFARATYDFGPFEAGVEASAGYSPFGKYFEQGVNAFLSFPLSSNTYEGSSCGDVAAQLDDVSAQLKKSADSAIPVLEFMKDSVVLNEANRRLLERERKKHVNYFVIDSPTTRESIEGGQVPASVIPISEVKDENFDIAEPICGIPAIKVDELKPSEVEKLPDLGDIKDCSEESLRRVNAYIDELKVYELRMKSQEDIWRKRLTEEVATSLQLSSWQQSCYIYAHGKKNPQIVVPNPVIDFSNGNADLALQPNTHLGAKDGFNFEQLDSWIRFLSANSQYRIRIDGYASEQLKGTKMDKKNLAIAQRRADMVGWYLTHRWRQLGEASRPDKYKTKDGHRSTLATTFPGVSDGELMKIAAEGSKHLGGSDPVIVEVKGHDKSDLAKYAEEEGLSGVKFTDPRFKAAKITLLEQDASTKKWVPVKLKRITQR